MRSHSICHIFLLISAFTLNSTGASDPLPKKNDELKLRGSIRKDDRSLNVNGNGYNMNNGGWNYNGRGRNYNPQQNNNYMRNYSYGRYYGNYYGARNRNYYGYGNPNQYYQSYYDNEDKDADLDEQDNGGYYDADDGISSNNSTFSNVFPSEFEERFWQWYESPPSDWTAAQWAWFSGILSVTVAFMFCCCVGCANICMEGQERACTSKDDFDDYQSIDNAKSGSFMTLNTKVSGGTSTAGGSTAVSVNTEESDDDADDDATYDSIMRLRSAG